jgi:hypothetical protein
MMDTVAFLTVAPVLLMMRKVIFFAIGRVYIFILDSSAEIIYLFQNRLLFITTYRNLSNFVILKRLLQKKGIDFSIPFSGYGKIELHFSIHIENAARVGRFN